MEGIFKYTLEWGGLKYDGAVLNVKDILCLV